jgi:hypothetical protein
MRTASMLLGAILGIMLMVAAMWGWNRAAWLGQEATRPEVIAWAVRSGAIALAAGAQVLMLSVVVGGLYRRDMFSDTVRLSAALVCSVALVSATALALAGR